MKYRYLIIIPAIVVLLMSLLQLNIKANYYESYSDTGNVLSYDSPYNVTYNMADGPYSDMFSILIEGNFNELNYITIEGLSEFTFLDAINYSSGAGFYSQIKYDSSNYIRLDSVYGQYQYLMVYNMTDYTVQSVKIYIHYNLTSGLTQSSVMDILQNNLKIYFNSIPNIKELIDTAYNEGVINGYDNALNDTAYDIYNNGISTYGYDYTTSNDYLEGYTQGASVEFDTAQMFMNVLDGIEGIFFLEVFPNMTVGMLFMIPYSFAIFKWFMKIFGGK